MTMKGRPIIDESPPGAWRAALAPDAFCAVCGQLTCSHPDALYAGIVPNTVPHASGDTRG